MKIDALRLYNVKRFAGKGVAIEGIADGVNVLCAANEYGKSTSFEALHALFFQPHSSTGSDVRNLRPYSGGNPLVETDISAPEGRFRITKQFYNRGFAKVVDLDTGRLVAQADEAENFIAGIVRGGTAGPAGLLWVRQGVTGIEKRSKSEEEGETKVRTSLLQSVQGEVEAVTGGRRMSEIMAAVEQELARLVTTTGKPKTGERYAVAIEERNRLVEAEAKLAEEVRLLRDALDRRAAAVKRLGELDRSEDRAERRRAIEEAQAGFDAAKSRAEKLRAAQAELALVVERRDNARRELDELQSALERSAALEAKLREAERDMAEATALRDATTAAAANARAELEAAEKEEQEARALLARLDAALKARDAAERLAEIQGKLESAEAVRRQMDEDEAALKLLRLSAKDVEDLEALEVELARLRAVAEAARTTVAIAYEEGAPRITLDGTPLNDGEARAYDGVVHLKVPNVGTVTLRSGQAAGGSEKLQKAEERRRGLLAAMGVVDLADARRRQVDVQRKEGELRERKAQLLMLAPQGLEKLREEVASLRAATGEVLELKEDPVQAQQALDAAEARRLSASQDLRERGSTLSSVSDAVAAAQARLATLSAERAQVEAILGPVERRDQRKVELTERLAALDTNLQSQQAIVDGLRGEAIDLAAAEAKLVRVRSAADAAEKEAAGLREEIAGHTAEIRARSDEAVEEKWQECTDALRAARKRVAAYEKEVAVLQRLRSALDTARSHAQETYLMPVMSELRPLLGLLFDDVSITFDEKTLLPSKILRAGQEEEVERLSGGMREQLSILTRLAFARLLAKDGRPAPVILDDALVYSDDDRIEKMFDALHRQAREQQIIIFSCRQRAFQKLGGNILKMSSWTPD